MDEFMLKDTWRDRNPDSREYSWSKRVGIDNRKASRIDLALISGGLDQKTMMITYLSSIMTDHRAIYIVIDFTSCERGKGFLKFNTSHLSDRDFLQTMNREIENTKICGENKNPVELWETIKMRIQKISKEYSRRQTSENKIVICQLSEKVNEYEASFPLREEEDKMYINTKTELEDKMLEKSKGLMFRSKARWYEEGEKNTKYFYSLEKARYNAKTCYKVI